MNKPVRALLVGAVAVAALLVFTLPIRATETIDYDAINKIKQLGLDPTSSKVMEIMSYLTDVYGPRLTGSPNVKKAADWTIAQMQQWGLTNVAEEPWTPCPANASTVAGPGGRGNGGPASCGFPRGWVNEKFYLAAVSPQAFPIPGTPTGWTPGTKGLVRGDVVMLTGTTLEDLQGRAGQLQGKWVLRTAAPDVAAYWNAPAHRYTQAELDAFENPAHPPELGVPAPAGRGAGRGTVTAPGTPCGGRGVPDPCAKFLTDQGILGTLATAPRGHGIYTIGGSSTTSPDGYAQVVIPAEQYGRIARLLEKGLPVTLEADIKNTYVPNPPMFNIVGEITGTDQADEVVMLGAHFDSWHASTGATDNGAGSGAMLEAMRILKASGVRLRRTVRLGLWTGEEEGLLGSRDYVARQFGAPPNAGRGGAPATPPPAPTPAQVTALAKFAAYFNIDNGTGAIRGVYLQGNEGVAPIFREWMEPFHTLGMTTLTIENTGGTDHQSFDAVNLPGFQFIQDEIEYNAITHHTNLDAYERLQPEDMRRNATIAAAFAYLAANRDDRLPRKPVTSPFVAAGRGRGGTH